MDGTAGNALRVRSVIGGAGRVLRKDWRPLLILGLALFVPLGLLVAIAPGEGAEIEISEERAFIPALALGSVQIIVPLIGTVFFAGVVAATVAHERHGVRSSLGEIIRELPYGKLVAADLLLVLAIGVGLLLFLLPGIIALVWFCLVAPVIEREGATVWGAFRRSRALVRGHFRQVAAIVWPVVVVQTLVDLGVEEGIVAALGHGFLGQWLTSVLSNLIVDPIFALFVVTIYLELREIEAR